MRTWTKFALLLVALALLVVFAQRAGVFTPRPSVEELDMASQRTSDAVTYSGGDSRDKHKAEDRAANSVAAPKVSKDVPPPQPVVPLPAVDEPVNDPPKAGPPKVPTPDDPTAPPVEPIIPTPEPVPVDPGTETEIPAKPIKRHSVLDWLSAHQHEDGLWRPSRFHEDSARNDARKSFNAEFVSPGFPGGDVASDESFSVGVTAMALLAMSGQGFDHKQGDYKQNVRRALVKMKKDQREDGGFADTMGHNVFINHAIATAAFAEMYSLSGDNLLKGILERAVKYLIAAQRENGGWGDEVRGIECNARATAWAILALKQAAMAGLEGDFSAMKKGAAYLTTLTRGEGDDVRTWYDDTTADRPLGADFEANAILDAMNIVCQLYAGALKADSAVVKVQLKRITATPATWEKGKVDFEFWWWASMATFQAGDDAPKARRVKDDEDVAPPPPNWRQGVVKLLLARQRGFSDADKAAKATDENLDEYGSWDAVDPFASCGGRIWSTAMASLTLQIYYRYGTVTEIRK